METGKFNEASVVKQLQLKQDIKIDPSRKEIKHHVGAQSKGDVGIKAKGKLDYLRKYCGYKIETFTDAKIFSNA